MSQHPHKKEPRPPFPEQQQPKPGLESELTPRPRYKAPAYKGSGKLKGKVALITGGDSGIGRAVAVLYAREGADVAIPRSLRNAVTRRKHNALLKAKAGAPS